MRTYAGCLLLFLGLRAWAGQAPTPAQSQPEGIPVARMLPGTAYSLRPITDKPYSAKQVTEHMQTLADGTHVTSPTRTVSMYRDSLGRTRIEQPMGPPSVADQYLMVEIRDPIAQVQYTLDPVNKVAHRVSMQAPPRRDPIPAGVTAANSRATSANNSASVHSENQSEDLGPQVMEGLAVHGMKHTTTIPVGALGNDRPLVTVREEWIAGNYFTVLSHVVDPRVGETTTKMTDVSTAEPDPSLFAPPADYSVIDETGPFQIKFVAQPKQQQ